MAIRAPSELTTGEDRVTQSRNINGVKCHFSEERKKELVLTSSLTSYHRGNDRPDWCN